MKCYKKQKKYQPWKLEPFHNWMNESSCLFNLWACYYGHPCTNLRILVRHPRLAGRWAQPMTSSLSFPLLLFDLSFHRHSLSSLPQCHTSKLGNSKGISCSKFQQNSCTEGWEIKKKLLGSNFVVEISLDSYFRLNLFFIFSNCLDIFVFSFLLKMTLTM